MTEAILLLEIVGDVYPYDSMKGCAIVVLAVNQPQEVLACLWSVINIQLNHKIPNCGLQLHLWGASLLAHPSS